MGSPPPPDAPEEIIQAAFDASLSFEPGPTVIELCGFKIPFFIPKFKFKIPKFSFPPELPTFKLAISISCNVNNPINITADIGFGGQRKPLFDPDPDLEDG